MKIIILLLLPVILYAQSDLDKVLRGSEIILSGLSIFKIARSDPKSKKNNVESLCVNNRMLQKITFRITGKDHDQNDFTKELIAQGESKECLYDLPKGIYTYEIMLAGDEPYRKGEYKIEDSATFVVEDP